MSGTPRLDLPFLSAGQAQKEWTHNEALQTLDILVSGAVEEEPRADPPASPILGAAYIVGASPTGAWAGKPQTVAAYTNDGWRFVVPVEGMRLYVKSTSLCSLYRAGNWEIGVVRGANVVIGGEQVVGARQGAIASPAGGATTDSEARAAVDQILNAMRAHGLIES